jgi:NAD(P)-dependent dehydrogenase (short-subunit alcohol dehydrogenase family)
VNDIKLASNNEHIQGFIADFSSLREVRQLVHDILSRHERLDVLINNAGAGTNGPRYGKDGIETILTVNYLAPVVLTSLLLPALKKAAPARIVNVSSAGQSAIQFDDIQLEKNFDSLTAYMQSKLALIMHTFALAEQLKPDNITVNAMHPGTYLDTNMVRQAGVTPLGTAQSGADAEIYLATAAELKTITGRYFNVTKEAKAHPQAYDSHARRKLGEITRKLIGEL